jgi:hypothetical protein
MGTHFLLTKIEKQMDSLEYLALPSISGLKFLYLRKKASILEMGIEIYLLQFPQNTILHTDSQTPHS